jgi:hypothetical protein
MGVCFFASVVWRVLCFKGSNRKGNVLSAWEVFYNSGWTRTQQGYTNFRRQIARVTKFCTVAPNICWSSVWNMRIVTRLVPGISRCFVDFWKMSAPLIYGLHCWHCVGSTMVQAGGRRPLTAETRQPLWDLWCTKWHWHIFISRNFTFPLSLSFHYCSILIHSSTTHDV